MEVRKDVPACLFQVLIYHGALDIICHFPGAQEMLVRANWTGKEAFHHSERRSMWFYNEVRCVMVSKLRP